MPLFPEQTQSDWIEGTLPRPVAGAGFLETSLQCKSTLVIPAEIDA
jgi:hypothetical protein